MPILFNSRDKSHDPPRRRRVHCFGLLRFAERAEFARQTLFRIFARTVRTAFSRKNRLCATNTYRRTPPASPTARAQRCRCPLGRFQLRAPTRAECRRPSAPRQHRHAQQSPISSKKPKFSQMKQTYGSRTF